MYVTSTASEFPAVGEKRDENAEPKADEEGRADDEGKGC